MHKICMLSSYSTNVNWGSQRSTIGVLEGYLNRVVTQTIGYWIAMCSYEHTTAYAQKMHMKSSHNILQNNTYRNKIVAAYYQILKL